MDTYDLMCEIQHERDYGADPAYTPSLFPLPVPHPENILTRAARAEFERWLDAVDAQPIIEAVAA